jgi:putative MATE family efflux protein
MDEQKNAKQDLTQGGIFGTLLRLALPIAGSQLMQMLYNLTDMFWMGRIGTGALAATGTAGLFIWLSVGLMMVGKVGTEIGVSQARGRGDMPGAFAFARTGLYIAVTLGILYGSFMFLLREPLVGLFNFQEADVARDMATYMGIIAFGVPFTFISAAVGASFGASGNTRLPFIISTVGLTVNVILSPIFIFILGMGISGAALASIMAQMGVAAALLTAVKKSTSRPFEAYRFFGGYASGTSLKSIRADLLTGRSGQIIKWTIPIFLETTLFCLLTMITSRFEVSFGAYAVAMSRVGSQVESLTWLVGAGFGAALTVFVGQNYGAGNHTRIKKGVRYAAFLMTGWGVTVASILALGGGIIFSIFLPDPELRNLGIMYLRVLAICQIPMNLEGVFGNAFKGKGRTVPPSICSITSNVIRVPLAYILSRTSLGLLGIWIAVSFSACLRGIWVSLWYAAAGRQKPQATKAKPIQ